MNSATAEPLPEALARRPGRCRLCRQPIHVGDPVLELPFAWVHADCGYSYRRVIEEHAEEVEG